MQSRAGPLEAVINFNLGVALMFVSVGKLKTANHKRGVLAQPTGPLPKPGCLVATGRDCGRNLGRSKASQHAELWLSFVSALAVPTKNFPPSSIFGGGNLTARVLNPGNSALQGGRRACEWHPPTRASELELGISLSCLFSTRKRK
jgi:hypothetical protein